MKYLYKLETACSTSKYASRRSVVLDSASKSLMNALTLEVSELSEDSDDILESSSDEARTSLATCTQTLISVRIPKEKRLVSYHHSKFLLSSADDYELPGVMTAPPEVDDPKTKDQ